MQKNKILLFDFDGTLVDSLPLIKDIVNDLSLKYGYKMIDDTDLEIIREYSPKEILKHLSIPIYKIPFIAIDLKKNFQQKIKNLKWVKGMKEVLEELSKQEVRIGILTSNGRENVEAFLKTHDINYIDFIYTDVSIFGKAKSIEKALQKNRIDKKNCLYVGDEIRDIQAAKKAGIQIISVSWGFNNEDALKRELPDYLINNPKEIIDIVS